MKFLEHTKFLHRVNSPQELRELTIDELPTYCDELRQFIIKSVALNPGHLGSSLGAVELAVAAHYVFDTPNDKLIWDVGHQAYAHKIICHRRDLFDTNRKYGGISGFPKRSESEFDVFGGGHASTSISAAVGVAAAAELKKEKKQVVAIIGDGSMTGGLAFEGLNNAKGKDMLVILNDNNISIDPNVGGLSEYFAKLTTSRKYNRLKRGVWQALGFWPWLRRVLQKMQNGAKSFFLKNSNLFEALGFRYFGPVDGNDVKSLVRRFRDLRHIEGTKLLHVITLKGKGFDIAEREQTVWHAPGRFDPLTGEKEPASSELRYQEVFGYTLLELAKENEKIVGITPAMPTGSSLCIMQRAMPERVFDVGIAEGHAVTFAAGLATENLLPFCCIYSSFAQRAVDNIINDVALQCLPMVLCLDRAGLVGEDGATHHGLFDIALLASVPNVVIAAPSSAQELRDMLYTASLAKHHGCFAIRYPRGGAFSVEVLDEELEEITLGKSRIARRGKNKDVVLLSIGDTLSITEQAAQNLDAEHIDLRFAKPLDANMLKRVAKEYKRIVVVENAMIAGGVGSMIRDFYAQEQIVVEVRSVGIEDRFIEHGSLCQLWEEVGLTTKNIEKCALM